MTPPAWSSLPAIGFIRTSTKPFSSVVLGRTQYGNVPLPDCCSTLGLLGAVGSATTAHFGTPLPVTPCCHADGSEPDAASSKVIISMRSLLSGARPVPEQNLDAEASEKRGVCWHPRVMRDQCIRLGHASSRHCLRLAVSGAVRREHPARQSPRRLGASADARRAALPRRWRRLARVAARTPEANSLGRYSLARRGDRRGWNRR